MRRVRPRERALPSDDPRVRERKTCFTHTNDCTHTSRQIRRNLSKQHATDVLCFVFFPSPPHSLLFNSCCPDLFTNNTHDISIMTTTTTILQNDTASARKRGVCVVVVRVFLFCFDKSFPRIRDACTRASDVCGPDKVAAVTTRGHVTRGV